MENNNVNFDFEKFFDDSFAGENIDSTDIKGDEKNLEENDPVDIIDDKDDDNLLKQDTVETKEDSTSLKAYYDINKEEGLLYDPDNAFDGSEESLLQIKENTINHYKLEAYKELWEKLPSEYQQVLRKGLSGEPLTSNDLDVDNVDLSKASNQKDIIKAFYKETSNLSDDKINKLVAKMDGVELEEEALEALDKLKEIKEEKAAEEKQRRIAFEKAEKENQQKMRKTIFDTVDNDFKDTTKARKIKALMFNPIKRGESTSTDFQYKLEKLQQNPKHLVQLASLLLDFDEEKGFNFEKYKKEGSNEAVRSLKNRLEQKTTEKPSASNNQNFPWAKFLDL